MGAVREVLEPSGAPAANAGRPGCVEAGAAREGAGPAARGRDAVRPLRRDAERALLPRGVQADADAAGPTREPAAAVPRMRGQLAPDKEGRLRGNVTIGRTIDVSRPAVPIAVQPRPRMPMR